ncbi:hypothetical protein [Halomonas sp. BM-2019]|uniref:hypothetical protein n=1 Tax=Halomonas sp. BM-2019 TaxID=2811227 RepID=UPI001B3C1DF2|nr:MAG: hypothetical protein J5F18_05335 [Halomonas sp. BM-2019]
MDYPLPLCSSRDRQLARQLIEDSELRFEAGFDDLVGLFRDGRLAACGARHGRVLKMLVVAPEYRGEGLIGEIITELMRLGQAAGEDGFFIFTRPCAVDAFVGLGFKPLAETGKVTLLEHGHQLHRYLAERAPLMRSGNNAAVLVNANPFTFGHAHLVEQAARIADTVYVFVHRDGPYLFPPALRLELARRGVAHISNAVVTDTGPYRLRAEAFPSYFLGPDDDAERIRVNLEGQLFGRHIAPAFHIRTRVVGSEPLDPAGRGYNQLIRPALAEGEIRLVEIDRTQRSGLWINTRQARKALRDGDVTRLAAMVPEAVLAHLRTPEVLDLLSADRDEARHAHQ